MPLTETGFHDVRGIPICVGDLIRVKHFRHYRRREQMWIYFRVAEKCGRFVVQNWNDLDATNHQCQLADCGVETAEVLDGETEIERGGKRIVKMAMWNERKRKKVTA
jgi:hypothetical protein